MIKFLNILSLYTFIFFRILLPVPQNHFRMVRLCSADENRILRKIGILYDMLSDAVDEINSLFSKMVKSN